MLYKTQLGFGANSWMLTSVFQYYGRSEECSVAPGSRLDPEVTIYASFLFQSVGVLHELSVSHFDIYPRWLNDIP